jgi:hypothetical protein
MISAMSAFGLHLDRLLGHPDAQGRPGPVSYGCDECTCGYLCSAVRVELIRDDGRILDNDGYGYLAVMECGDFIGPDCSEQTCPCHHDPITGLIDPRRWEAFDAAAQRIVGWRVLEEPVLVATPVRRAA